MHFQFGNSYTTIKFDKENNINFQEFMGYLFITISNKTINNLIEIYVNLSRYVCGPDLYQLQYDSPKSSLYSLLIEKLIDLKNSDQSICIEAVEQLVVNPDISFACLQTLKDSIGQLVLHTECSRTHALLFVENKVLSLYSSSNAKQLSPADILFTLILKNCKTKDPGDLESFQVLLAGSDEEAKSFPHAVHVVDIFENVCLVYLIEVGDFNVAGPLYESFHHLHRLRFIQAQREKDSIQLGFENLSLALKKLEDGLKRTKVKTLLYKQLSVKWDILRAKYRDYLKTLSEDAIIRAETLTIDFCNTLMELHRVFTTDENVLRCSLQHVTKVVTNVTADLMVFKEFFKAKGLKNFTLGSRDSLTINKYLEEFPGLVHFLYIDRNTHRVTTPALDMNVEKAEFIKKRIWSMVKFSHSHLQSNHTTLIWKDKIFTYGYFVWFEDSSGGGLKIPLGSRKIEKWPGIFGEDYFRKLKINLFPKTSPSKVRTYELFVMYLGLVTAESVLEQTRKLAAAVWDLKGFPMYAMDLL